jgi:beta-fructofuranosidase
MMLLLDDHWVWDFWFARHEGRYHVFFLKAPKSLGDPDRRHQNARIGHAVSGDLRDWEVLPDALHPGPDGAWDSRATWTGSVIRHDGRWFMFYSGIGSDREGLVQRIGLAVSEDLVTWEKPSAEPILAPDPRWYETLDLDVWIEETCRDPWVFPDPSGDGFRMYYTARSNWGEPDGRGVIGQARSTDLFTWEALPPVTEPGDYGHLEVPQVVAIEGRYYLLFSVYDWAHSAARKRRADAVCGTHYLIGDSPLGPFSSPGDEFLFGTPEGPFYAARLIEDPDGRWVFMSWAQFAPDGSFVGALADPVPVEQRDDGSLHLTASPIAPPDRLPDPRCRPHPELTRWARGGPAVAPPESIG